MIGESTVAKVALWNVRCSKRAPIAGSDKYWEALTNQAKRIEEELKELTDAIELKDPIGTFDALLDLDVVVAGGIYLSSGNYDGGIRAVLKNNDTKFTDRESTALMVQAYHEEKGTACTIYVHTPLDIFEQKYFSIHRDSDDKILKFPGHVNPDLAQFVATMEGN